MRDYLKEFDQIICSDNVVDRFYLKYNGDVDFKGWLDKFLPDIQKCEKQGQNNPWHKYNVLGHILHSIESINALSKTLPQKDRRLLSYVMLFHDIGKPDKHIVREKGGAIRDSFFNHNIRSEEIAKCYLPKLGFSEEEVKVMAKLIYKHDIFMFIKPFKSKNQHWRVLNEKLIEEEIADLNQVGNGEKLLKYLIMVGRADNLAQNEKMTAQSLAMLDKFDEMLAEMKKYMQI